MVKSTLFKTFNVRDKMKHKKAIIILIVIILAAIVLPLAIMLIGIMASRVVPLWVVALILLVVAAVIAWKAGIGREDEKRRDNHIDKNNDDRQDR